MKRETLLGDDIFVVRGFLSGDECDALIRQSEQRGYEAATLSMGDTTMLFTDFRDNSRVIVDHAGLAGRLFLRIREQLPELEGRLPIGLNERFRFYRYDPGQTFAPHQDYPFERSAAEASALTLMVYLSDDFTGGRTDFYRDDETPRLSVKPERGKALLFRHELLHAGTRVESGRKYVLRTDVMYPTRRLQL